MWCSLKGGQFSLQLAVYSQFCASSEVNPFLLEGGQTGIAFEARLMELFSEASWLLKYLPYDKGLITECFLVEAKPIDDIVGRVLPNYNLCLFIAWQ